MGSVLLESRAFKPFKSGEEYLEAMKEDLAEWLQAMYPHLGINPENFMDRLETGVALCEHANAVKQQAIEYAEKKQAKMIMSKSITGTYMQAQQLISIPDVKYFSTARAGTFFSRDNVCNFINWCRNSLSIIECLLFESDDLIMRKNEKHVILCLLEVARRGAKFGMLAPMLVQMERQIDREIAADQKKSGLNDGTINENEITDDEEDSDMEDEVPVMMYGPVPQIVTNDLKSLDEMVRDLVAKCTCPTQFPMIRVSEGKYRIGDTKVLIFVRILRNHVMVRVGGGWDTLSHYLDKHDPCRCRSQHRTTHGAKLVNKPGAADLHGSHVYYDRSAGVPAIATTAAATTGNSPHSLGPPMNSLNRSRSRSPSQANNRRSVSPNVTRKSLVPPPARSRSPTPNFTSTHHAKLKMSAKTSPKHVTSVNIPVNQKNEIHNAGETDQSDTTSELSDEGYRSLGIVQDKNKQQRSSVYSQNSAEDVEDNEHQIDGIDDLNDIGLRKTNFSQIYDNTLHSKPPPTRANSADPPASPKVSRKSIFKTTNTGTWNGRTKATRASLTTDTFSPFSRNSLGRRSVSDVRRASNSANTSPTKTRLKQEIIETIKAVDDEAVMVEKIQEVLEKYRFGDDASPTFGRGAHDRMSMRSPRRDTRPENQFSRIPAPVNKA